MQHVHVNEHRVEAAVEVLQSAVERAAGDPLLHAEALFSLAVSCCCCCVCLRFESVLEGVTAGTAAFRSCLQTVLGEQSQLDAAEAAYAACLKLRLSTLGDEHVSVGHAVDSLAVRALRMFGGLSCMMSPSVRRQSCTNADNWLIV